MTTEDFSNQFDTLIGAYTQTLPTTIPGSVLEFDEYEKSVFLTEAQEALVLNYYSDSTSPAFETNEEVRRYLESIVETDTPSQVDTIKMIGGKVHTTFQLQENLWFIIYEEATYSSGGGCYANIAEVVPTTHDSYKRVLENPFRGPSRKRVLRLDCGSNCVELVSVQPIKEYKVRYIKRPAPIILQDLDEPLEINGVSKRSECKLNSALHKKILDAAVQLAIASRSARKTE